MSHRPNKTDNLEIRAFRDGDGDRFRLIAMEHFLPLRKEVSDWTALIEACAGAHASRFISRVNVALHVDNVIGFSVQRTIRPFGGPPLYQDPRNARSIVNWVVAVPTAAALEPERKLLQVAIRLARNASCRTLEVRSFQDNERLNETLRNMKFDCKYGRKQLHGLSILQFSRTV